MIIFFTEGKFNIIFEQLNKKNESSYVFLCPAVNTKNFGIATLDAKKKENLENCRKTKNI